MPTSRLRKLLDDNLGSLAFEMIVPHTFLPPRFRRESPPRNMVLLFSQDLTLHIRWEGALRYEPQSLTPRAACHLIKEVLSKMAQYRRELRVFSRFIEQFGELPTEESPNDSHSSREAEPSKANEANVQDEDSKEVEVEAYLLTSCRKPLDQMVSSNE